MGFDHAPTGVYLAIGFIKTVSSIKCGISSEASEEGGDDRFRSAMFLHLASRPGSAGRSPVSRLKHIDFLVFIFCYIGNRAQQIHDENL